MKKTMNKTVKNNMINYGIVIALFVIVQILSGTGHLSRLLTGLLVPLCVYVIAAISLNLVVGFSGELSLGHAGFMCVGAYSSALFSHIASDIPQVPRFILAILIGAAVAAVFGVIIGIPVLRLRGDYLAIVTLAFGEIIKNLINILYIGFDEKGLHVATSAASLKLEAGGKQILKGALGISGTGALYKDVKHYFFPIGIFLVLLTLFIVQNLVNSRSGRAIMATRDNRIAAESANPIADVLWGGGADSLAAFKEYFQPYVCANDEFIGDAYKDPDDLWIGESPLPMVIFYNKDLIEKDGLTIPESWEDLTKPEWKGKIAYCLPSKSGSAYTQLCTMILGHGGKEAGWDFIKQLYDNLDGKIVDSSGKCHKMVADGEFYVGLTIEKSAIKYADDPSVGFVYPKDGTSAVPDGVALVKGCPNEENAKLFIDFVTSKECQTEQSQNWGRRPVRSDMEVGEGMAKLEDLVLVDYDFDWAANEKEANIEKFNDIMVN